MQILPLWEVRARPSEITDEVDRTHARVSITRNGRACVVLMSATDLESMEATIELGDSQAVQHLNTAQTDVAADGFTTATEMRRLMAERRASGR